MEMREHEKIRSKGETQWARKRERGKAGESPTLKTKVTEKKNRVHNKKYGLGIWIKASSGDEKFFTTCT